MKLNLGCGIHKLKGWVNVDYNPEYKPDMVVDLNKIPLSWKDNTIDEINCFHIIEHLNDIRAFMKELYRIGKNGCVIHFRYPHFSDRSAYADPTHKHYLSHASLQYFEEVHLKEPEALTHDIRFRTIRKKVNCNPLFSFLVNLNPDFWERHRILLLLSGMHEIELDLMVIK